mmetsp:Transcript_6078/g.18363  ORF Transcript_6078/g.18363 Transcript_6078/m.18363 type:complete len:593 (+) Transcript_6078:278-2056(+)
MSKEQHRAFIKGRQIRLDAERLLLVEKVRPTILEQVEVGWKNRVGKVHFRTATITLRGTSLLFDIFKDGEKAYSVAVPLEGSDFIMEGCEILQLYTNDGSSYMWIRFRDEDVLKKWMTALNMAMKAEVNLSDFDIIRAVGKGGMGKVFLAVHRRTGERLALKVIDKKSVFNREGHLQHMVDERLLLEMGADHPFVLKLRYAFQTESNFFLATEFCEGGDLYHLLKRRRKTLSEEAARLISSEVILALESMHKKGCVYRDLKPDNVLLDTEGHVRLADFGLAKLLKGEADNYERTNSFCGTAQYTPPEMIQKKYYSQSVDLWCLGVFLYEVIEGSTPFYTRERDRMYRRIEKDQVKFSNRFSETAKDLIIRLLVKNPKERCSLEEVKQHKFFENVDWEMVKEKAFWPKCIYTSKEKKEVAMQDLRIINTDRYKNLTVDESDEIRGLRALRLTGKKQPTYIVPGFNYTSPEAAEEERRTLEAGNEGTSVDAQETARRIMEQATQKRKRSFRSTSLKSRLSRGDSLHTPSSPRVNSLINRSKSDNPREKQQPSIGKSGILGRRILSIRGNGSLRNQQGRRGGYGRTASLHGGIAL